MKISGNIIDLHARRIFFGQIEVENGLIKQVSEKKRPRNGSRKFILPGFVDAHVHIESSMLAPSEFARLAVRHGTVGTVSDPHEIANVLGKKGVEWMLENAAKVPFKASFGSPSCVPATNFETAGATLNAADVADLLADPRIFYLSEMMNWPGAIHGDDEVLKKIAAAQAIGKPVDGHAPGLIGEPAKAYFSRGISTDHECFSLAEGFEKAALGIKILIREGSAARNFEALHRLFEHFPDQLMFCSDDKHPDELLKNHIDELVRRALRKGNDLFEVLSAACKNPVDHYRLPIGLLRAGDAADFIVCEVEKEALFSDFQVKETWIGGQLVAKNGSSKIRSVAAEPINQFHIGRQKAADFRLKKQAGQARVIHCFDGEIMTDSFFSNIESDEKGFAKPDLEKDILLFTVVNRYQKVRPAVAFIHGFGLKTGAIASCVGHDSHNILAVGCDEKSLAEAVNLIVKNRGGIAAVRSGKRLVLPLPVAGILSADRGERVAKCYSKLDFFVKNGLGSSLRAPFMALSFMALLVIPKLKLSDRGLFDGERFEFVPVFEPQMA